MRYVSLFSGIEAATVAFAPLGWEAVAFAEIEPFPCAVLAHRFPDVPNLGDVTEIDWKKVIDEHGAVDLVCGGSPCQSFSIAGDRSGLSGESRLMFEYIRAVSDIRPRWFLWENVPGVFSTDHGRAFGILLDEMEKLGYGLAWRTLDAQFFGVAQRRRRVFLVGCLAGAGCAAAVLFERESVSGNTQSGKQKREELAARAARGAGGSYTLKLRHTGSSNGGRGGEGPLVQDDVSATLATNQDQTLFCMTPWDCQSKRIYSENGVAPCLNAGTRESGNIHPSVFCIQGANGTNQNENGSGYSDDDVSYTLNCTDRHGIAYTYDVSESKYDFVCAVCGEDFQIEQGPAPFVTPKFCPECGRKVNTLAFDESQITSRQNGNNPQWNDACHTLTLNADKADVICMSTGQANAEVCDDHSPTLNAAHEQPIIIDRAAFNQGANAQYPPHIEQSELMDTIVTRGPHAVCVKSHDLAIPINTMVATRYPNEGIGTGLGIGEQGEAQFTLSAAHEHAVCAECDKKYIVRRLTPLECERLQGFPDGWTDIPYKGNEHPPDSPRYKALGNSWAVPCAAWIGRRIQQVEDMMKDNPERQTCERFIRRTTGDFGADATT